LPEHVVLTLWTAETDLAAAADRAGVDRVGVDLEHLGKATRQTGRSTWLSEHRLDDLERIAKMLDRAAPFARVNPINASSAEEIDGALAAGAEVLMLPMVESAATAASFATLVDGRATTVLLVERREAVDALGELVSVEGIDEVHIGLNDLSISLGLANRWLVLAGDIAFDAGRIVRDAGLRFGLGGIGRVHDDALPIPSDLVYAELARTGATATLLARSFRPPGTDLATEVVRTRARLDDWQAASQDELDAAHSLLAERASDLAW
jgi:hypothetical protein